MGEPFLFVDNPEDPEMGPDEKSAEPAIEDWLMNGFGSMTVAERIATAESLDRYDVADKIRAEEGTGRSDGNIS
jgi:hypothetical protein